MIRGIIIKYLFNKSYIRILKGGKCNISPKSRIRRSHIIIYDGGELQIDDNVILDNVDIILKKGKLSIAKNSIITSRKHKVEVNLENGNIVIGKNSKISCSRIWCRFGGNIKIGHYTNINDWSEIRSDERVEIGSFNQISYNVRIWDTNTHQILPKAERRIITKEYFPVFGKDLHRPVTMPVIIGDDCWIGEYSSILKGVTIGNGCVIGFGTFITKKNIPVNSQVYNKRDIIINQGSENHD